MKSKGILKYYEGNKLVVEIDEELARYYRYWIPKYISFNKPMHLPHVTVVRGAYETPTDKSKWGSREGEEIEFEYENDIKIGRVYIWLPVQSKKLEEIRKELGLDRCFDKFKGFHITIANTKKL